jgi:hypothetical protein
MCELISLQEGSISRLDQNDKTNQSPVNEKSGNSESKSKSEEEAERKESVNIEAVINTDNVQNETRKRKIQKIYVATKTRMRIQK